MTTKCIICFESVNNTNSCISDCISECRCVHVCDCCLPMIDLLKSVYAYGGRKWVKYCSLNCIYNSFDYHNDLPIMFRPFTNPTNYYANINKHQQFILDQYEYKKCYSQLDNYFIPDLTKIICDYLVNLEFE